ncbi:fad-dependent oxygenase [Stemphylium lycopersici]|uniref:FAD-binding domain-containing protein n=1 Tax=Stemphylium lycopersici TaxID=183478 RepID=A0A364MU81_STELY|nr:fad-dependent oxygenase [Stemphylium lycopersici]RAR02975.1 FAD-binding domain-containing protein [Stemphylium lycopersici]
MLCKALWAATTFAVALVAATPFSSSQNDFAACLSEDAEIWYPGSEEFANATLRWGAAQTPQYDMVVKVATEADVQQTIMYANAHNKSFHAISGAHATSTYLNNIENAVGIFLRGMNNLTITESGETAIIGGGILNGDVIDYLWANDKETMTTACACVGYVSPILGGGHGWNQGRYGLASDQLVSARMVLANGTAITVSEDGNPELFWAIRGAGHNFGVVTQAEIKIYDIKPSTEQWAVSGFFFTHDKMEDVVAIANTWLESADRPVELEHYIVFSFDPEADAVNPIVAIWVIWQGAAIPAQYTDPFAALEPLSTDSGVTNLAGVSAFLGAERNGPSCEKGFTRSLVPVSADTYDAPSLHKVIEIMATFPSEFRASVVLFESYSTNRVGQIPDNSTAYPDRDGQLLYSPLMTYQPNATLDAAAWKYAGLIRDTLIEGTNKAYEAYVNYARGDETTEELYGYEPWRLERLRALKSEYDPQGKFNFFAPII